MAQSAGVDFVIITALEEERDSLLRKLSGYRKVRPDEKDIRVYYRAKVLVTFPDKTRGLYSVVVLGLLNMGRVQAASATSDAIRKWKPRYVLLIGIAGGISENGVALGDILISDQIIDYELQKVTPGGRQVRYQTHRVEPRLLTASQNYMDNQWLRLVNSKRPTEGTPKRLIGPVATGDKVIAFRDLLDQYRNDWPKLLGVEMEAGGAVTAAFEAANAPGFFMIRCVSDLADETKNTPAVEAWRGYACDVAAAYAVAFLQSGPVPLVSRPRRHGVLRRGGSRRPTKPNVSEVLAKRKSKPAGDASGSPGVKRQNGLIDWGPAPSDSLFFGREKELARICEWATTSRCRLMALLGKAGIGKTSLAVEVVKELKSEFRYIVWRSLQDALPLQELLKDIIDIISGHSVTSFSNDPVALISQLLSYLKRERSLIILDNVETILEGKHAGHYRPGYEQYAQLFTRVGSVDHQGCVIITSWEKPAEIANLEGKFSATRSLSVKGLEPSAALRILRDKELVDDEGELKRLIEMYSGNPKALRLVSEYIREVFGNSVNRFLTEGSCVIGDIRELLNRQFDRLSEIESHIMYSLAIEREAVSPRFLASQIAAPYVVSEVDEAVLALRRRELVETTPNGITLEHVVMEYVREKLIASVCEEVCKEQFTLFNSHALMRSQSKDYVRNSQRRIIVRPVVEKLLKSMSRDEVVAHLENALAVIKEASPRRPGFAACNALCLLVELHVNIQGRKFENLCVRQAYLQEVELHDVSFLGSDLTDTVFADTFGSITAVALDHAGTLLAAGTFNGQVRIWQMSDGKQLFNLDGHRDWVGSVCFSPDDRIVASASGDQTIRLWDLVTGECLAVLVGHADRVRSIAFTPEGSLLASGSEDRSIRIWDVRRRECVSVLEGHSDRIKAIAISPDGELIATGGDDRTIRLWSVAHKDCVKALEGHSGWVRALAYVRDGNRLVSGGDDGTVRIWRLPDGECAVVLKGDNNKVWAVAASADGRLVASGGNDSTVRIWDVESGQCIRLLQGHSSWVRCIQFSPDDSLIVTGSEDQTLRVWNPRTGQPMKTLRGYANRVFSVVYGSDSSMIIGGLGNHKVHIWNIGDGRVIRTLRGHSDQVWTVAFSPIGNIVASGSDDRTVRLWDGGSGNCLFVLEGHSSWVGSIAFNRDGRILASGSDDQTIRLWDTSSGRCITILKGHSGRVSAVSFAGDGEQLVSGSEDGTVRIWRTTSGECLGTFRGHTSLVFGVAVSPNGRLAASGAGDQTIRLWDLETHECLGKFEGHSRQVWSVAFSPDGSTLASASDDRSIKIWEVACFRCVRTLEGHSRQVWSVAFSPDGSTLASASEDETVRVWRTETGNCIAVLRGERPYERMNIKDAIGLTSAQRKTLLGLGAVEVSRVRDKTELL